MCVCAFSRQILLCSAQNNWNFIGIFSLSSVILSNFPNLFGEIHQSFDITKVEKIPGQNSPKRKTLIIGKIKCCGATSTLFDGYQK
jgi:hypothetical protein